MSPLLPPHRILVTGANGYIATWVVHNLLHKGYHVLATVRSPSKGSHFAQEEWSKPFVDAGKLEVVVVEDLTKEGAFDEIVKRVDGVEHMASPFHMKADEPEELIGPAVNGTLNILKSVLTHGTSVKRVVITGSCASIMQILPTPTTFTEKDWNEQSIKLVHEQGRDTPAITKYRASKTLAEKAAWEFYENHKNQIEWDLVVLNPPYVFGPTLHPVASPAELGQSAGDFYGTITVPGYKTDEDLRTQSSSWIDVRDLAEAHVRALRTEEKVGGERIIVSAGAFVWQEWLDVANSLPPSYPPSKHTLAKGSPLGSDEVPAHFVKYDAGKAARLLHIGLGDGGEVGGEDWYRLRGMKEVVEETLEDWGKRGW